MICRSCRDKNHVHCESPDCTCGHAGSPVRPLTSAERQDVRTGRLVANVMPREATEGVGVGKTSESASKGQRRGAS